MGKISSVVFDLGGVLIDWNPRYLFRKVFKTEEEVEEVVDHIKIMTEEMVAVKMVANNEKAEVDLPEVIIIIIMVVLL